MIPKPLNTITEADLTNLIDNHVQEGKTIEYKRDLPGNSDGDKIRFLRAVSAFANTEGGDLLYGVDTIDGIPNALPGIGTVNQDELRLRLEAICRDGLEPRVPTLHFHFVPVNQARVLVIRIGKSWLSPHRVKFNSHGHFYARGSGGAYQMDVAELRTAFGMSQSIAERMKAFRFERTAKIHDHDTPVPISLGCKMVLHLLPLSAFASSQGIDVSEHHARLREVLPMGASARQRDMINLDGVLTYTNPIGGRSRAFTQIYRNGIMEAVTVFTPGDGDVKRIHCKRYEELLIRAVEGYLQLLNQMQINPPIYVFISFIGINDYDFVVPQGPGFVTSTTSNYAISLPEVAVTDYGIPAHTLLRPAFDMFWNAFGYPASQNFDGQGNWIP